MSRLRAGLALLALSGAGCATVLPNTAQVIAPATFADVAVGLAADAEMLLQITLIFVGI